MRLRLLISTVFVTALVGASAGTAPAIVGGERDGDAHPHVGTLQVPNVIQGMPGTLCSATLISPTLVLTAAHCFFFDVNPDPAVREFRQQTISAFRLADPVSPAMPPLALGTPTIHPGFDPATEDGFTDDLALVRLNAPVTAVTAFPALPPLQVIPPGHAKRTTATVVGFGLTAFPPGPTDNAIPPVFRHRKAVELSKGTPPNHVGIAQGPCFGDSGGPVLVEQTIVAVVSFGSGGCVDGLGYRLDTAAAQGFLADQGLELPRGKGRDR